MKDPRHKGNRSPSAAPTATEDTASDVIPAQYGSAVLAPTQDSPVEEAKADTNLAGEPKQRHVDQPDPPAMETAVLGRLEGLGILVVLRDADGNVVSADGSWQPGDESSQIDDLRQSFPEGSTTTYAGKAIESPGDRHATNVDLEVVVTGHGHYEAADGRTLLLVRFEPRQLG